MPLKILFLVPYPLNEAPSQRFRFEQYFQLLKQKGHHYAVQSFLTSQNWQPFFKLGKTIHKVIAILKGFFKRTTILSSVRNYDFVFIHRECAPVGPPVFEFIISKVLKVKIIYDFDDAIWLTDNRQESRIFSILKWRNKVAHICALAFRCSCGNQYLCNFASNYNLRVTRNPTTISRVYKNPRLTDLIDRHPITIGWTGSHSTLKYLHEIDAVIQNVLKIYPHVRILIVADKAPELPYPFEFVKWSLASEINDLLRIDIGIMPLPEDEWTKGKCGFKALQYMALEIPAVASPVGINSLIIDNGVNGYLCTSKGDWQSAFENLILDRHLRKKLGEAGRIKVDQNYSVSSNASNFLSLFENE